MTNLITKSQYFFNVWLWQEFNERSHLLWRWLIQTLRFTFIVISDLAKGDLNLRAMSLVFTTLLSLVPLIAVAFSVLKAFGVHNQIEPFLLGVLTPLGEKGVEISANIIGFVQNVKVGVLGSIGVAMLFYTIISLIQKIENAFNFVWRISRSRTLARRFTDYLSVVMIGPMLVVTAMGIAASAMNHNVVQSLEAIEPFGTLIVYTSKLIPYLMIILAFTFLYMFIPNTKVKIRSAFIGAVVAGTLWVSMGKIFASFVASSSSYTAIYSSFAILFFFMIWLYLGWLILLIGAQVAFYLQHPKLVRLDTMAYSLSPRIYEQEGLGLITLIAKQFYLQKPAPSFQQLEQETGLTSDILQELLMTLEMGGLIVELAGNEACYVPASDSSEITVKTALDCLRSGQENPALTRQSKVSNSVIQLVNKLNQQQKTVLNKMTLRELAMDNVDNG